MRKNNIVLYEMPFEEDMKIYRVHNDKFPHNPLPEQTEGFPVDLAGGKQ